MVSARRGKERTSGVLACRSAADDSGRKRDDPIGAVSYTVIGFHVYNGKDRGVPGIKPMVGQYAFLVQQTGGLGCAGNGKHSTVRGAETAFVFRHAHRKGADDRSVTWQSDNPDIAAISTGSAVISTGSNVGSVAAIRAGTTTLRVRTNDGGFTKTCQLTVLPHTDTDTETVPYWTYLSTTEEV